MNITLCPPKQKTVKLHEIIAVSLSFLFKWKQHSPGNKSTPSYFDILQF